MAPPRLIARHLSHPRGLLGRFVGGLMNRFNAGMNGFALEQLAVRKSDHVVEIGFGGGVTLGPLIEAAGRVTGVDRSSEMVSRANARFRAAVKAGRAEFIQGNIEALPLRDGTCTKACSVNTVYFWNSLEEGASELARVLAPGGLAALAFLPEEPMQRLGFPTDIFTYRRPDDVIASLKRASFVDISVRRPDPAKPWNVILARR